MDREEMGRTISTSGLTQDIFFSFNKKTSQRGNMIPALYLLSILIFELVNRCLADAGARSWSAEHAQKSVTHSFRETIPQLTARRDIVRQDRSHRDQRHEVIFVIRQRNMVQLTDILHDISNPLSPNYGQHMTGEEVAAMTSNPDARDAVVTYLLAKGAIIVSETLHGEYVKATAPIDTWERMFNTEFFTFHQSHSDIKVDKVTRAERYWIPLELDQHVESVFNTIQMPTRVVGSLPIPQSTPLSAEFTVEKAKSNPFADYVTPEKIAAYYNVGTNKGSSSSTQAIFSTIGQYFSPADLAYFQSTFSLPAQPVSKNINGHSSDLVCSEKPSSCAEGNLDIQYMMATSPGSPTTHWYTDLDLAEWLETVADCVKPPLVFSISYGADELSMSASEMAAFSTQAIKLSAMGVTLVAASGDDGAVSSTVRQHGFSACGYSPLFPASNPYILSVGGTTGIERGDTEVVAQGDNGQAFTSGGGFSSYFGRPSWQTAAVSEYFKSAEAAGHSPVTGYNINGRAYPDISLAGCNYAVSIGGSFFKVSGTSASAPAIAGFISNINAARMAAGKGSVGWINPTLYANHSAFVNDIVSGDTHCSANGICCPQGFEAGVGWDPATGLGSVNYEKMQSLFLSLGSTLGSSNGMYRWPSAKPAVPSFPTFRPTPTPTSAYHSYIQVSQTLEGLSLSQVNAPSFLTALQKTLTTALKLPVEVYPLTSSAHRRQLLVGISISYSFSVLSGLSSDAVITRLRTAIFSGLFLAVLKSNTGLDVVDVSELVILDFSPTSSPSEAPVSQASCTCRDVERTD